MLVKRWFGTFRRAMCGSGWQGQLDVEKVLECVGMESPREHRVDVGLLRCVVNGPHAITDDIYLSNLVRSIEDGDHLGNEGPVNLGQGRTSVLGREP